MPKSGFAPLKKIIEHADVSNKIKEENLMWNCHESRRRKRKRSPPEREARGSRSLNAKWQKTDGTTEPDASTVTTTSVGNGNENERWGHDGFERLYPENIVNRRDVALTSSDDETDMNNTLFHLMDEKDLDQIKRQIAAKKNTRKARKSVKQ